MMLAQTPFFSLKIQDIDEVQNQYDGVACENTAHTESAKPINQRLLTEESLRPKESKEEGAKRWAKGQIKKIPVSKVT